MERKVINELPEYPASGSYQPLKAMLNSLIDKVGSIEKDKSKENYLNTFKEMSWALGKCTPHWPTEVEELVLRLRNEVGAFESVLIEKGQKKGSFNLCGGGGKSSSESLEPIYKKIVGYQYIFSVIGVYQDKKLREDLVYNVMDILEKNNAFSGNRSRVSQTSIREESIKVEVKDNIKGMCDYCELMKSVSVCPNGFIAKKLLRELSDVEWIAGIMYEDGKIVDKNLEKAIDFYEKGKRKKNPEAIYRLGLLNERGQYGKPFEYLKLWEEAAKMGHLESMTDLGYLY